MINFKKISLSLVVASIVCFNGCGGSSNDNNTNNTTETGVFLDSAVEGITYKTTTKSQYYKFLL